MDLDPVLLSRIQFAFVVSFHAIVPVFTIGLNTLEEQPTKVAAMEGNWEASSNVPLLLFAWPDQQAQTNHFEVGIPGLASLILKHHVQGEVPGISAVPREEQSRGWALQAEPAVSLESEGGNY